jgi:hypothetical protein
VPHASGYGTAVDGAQETRFASVTTRCVRATFDASQAGGATAGVAVTEWEVLAPKPLPPVAAGSHRPEACRK